MPNTTNISFDGVEAEILLIALDLEGIAVSTGSACSSGTLEPSHVLRAMGLPAHRTQNSIRFSLGAGNTDAEVDALSKLPRRGSKLRVPARTVDRSQSVIAANRSSRSNSDRRIHRSRRGSCTSPCDRRRDVGRRRFVGGRGAAGRRQGTTSSVCRCSSTISRETATIALRELLHDRRSARRAARRGARSASPTTSSISSASSTSTSSRNFVSEYAAGRTPIPCAHCNGDLKFATLVERARRDSAPTRSPPATTRASSATTGPARYRPASAASIAAKDQSYFLFSLTQAQLAHAQFPGRRARQGRGARPRARARPAGRRQAGQPGDLLRAATATTRRSSRSAAAAARGGAIRDEQGHVLGTPRGRPPLHRRPAQGARPLLADAALRRRHRRRASETVTVGPRDALERTHADRVRRELDRRRRRPRDAIASPPRSATATRGAGDGRRRATAIA